MSDVSCLMGVLSCCCRFLAVDRGALRYPSYCVRRSRSVFASRQCLLEYEAALQLAAQVDKALEVRESGAWETLCDAALGCTGWSIHM